MLSEVSGDLGTLQWTPKGQMGLPNCTCTENESKDTLKRESFWTLGHLFSRAAFRDWELLLRLPHPRPVLVSHTTPQEPATQIHHLPSRGFSRVVHDAPTARPCPLPIPSLPSPTSSQSLDLFLSPKYQLHALGDLSQLPPWLHACHYYRTSQTAW